ncbi:hypothetical protein [Azospirillum baldaniorum]|nr:hypothetical protein [Azospirillum baldaniorum]
MWLIEIFGTIYVVASSVVGTAAVIASVTPTPKDDEWVAFNIGNARNR